MIIKEYGIINSFTTNTYESLYKDAIKKSYRVSNKRNVTDQMIKMVSVYFTHYFLFWKLCMLNYYYCLQVYRNSFIKYLYKHITAVNWHQQKTSMNGLLNTFFLKDFDKFFNNYKLENILANEALMALDYFLPALDEFFGLYKDITDVKNAKIRWYSYTNVTFGEDYIRAKSKHYNEPSFSDMSINMSEKETEDYNIVESACFDKVQYIIK